MSRARNSMSASLWVGKRHPPTRGLRAPSRSGRRRCTPSTTGSGRAPEPRARGRGRSAPRPRPCRPELTNSRCSVVERRELHEHGRRVLRVRRAARAARGRSCPSGGRARSTRVDVESDSAAENQSAVRSSTSSGSSERFRHEDARRRTSCQTPRVMNRQVVLAGRRPQGHGHRDCFEVVEIPVPELGAGEALLEVRVPRHRPDDPRLARRARQLHARRRDRRARPLERRRRRGRDQQSRGVSARARRSCTSPAGSSTASCSPNPFPPITIVAEGVELLDMLGVLGHVGITAYLGVHRGREAATRRDVLSFRRRRAASGRSRARSRRCEARDVIGIAGSAGEVRVGRRRARLRRVHRLQDRRRRGSAQGARAARASTSSSTTSAASCSTPCCAGSRNRGRVVLCGDISTYNLEGPPPPLHNITYLMGKRARMEGFNTLDHWDHYAAGAAQLAEWVADGTHQAPGARAHGIDRAPEALVRLFTRRPPRQARRPDRLTPRGSVSERRSPRPRRSPSGVRAGVPGRVTRNVAPCRGS